MDADSRSGDRIRPDERIRFLYGRIEGRTARVLEVDSSGGVFRYLVDVQGMEPFWCFRQEFARLEFHTK